jgi:molecular chaperone DnaK (HSP70)
MNARFSVGIDLGTSNSAIAVADIESGDTKIVEIEQIVGPNQLGELPT